MYIMQFQNINLEVRTIPIEEHYKMMSEERLTQSPCEFRARVS